MSIKRVFLFAVLTSLLSLVALSASAQDEITIRYTLWIPPDAGQMEAFNAIKADYEEMNPGVVIEYDFIPFNDYESVLTHVKLSLITTLFDSAGERYNLLDFLG